MTLAAGLTAEISSAREIASNQSSIATRRSGIRLRSALSFSESRAQTSARALAFANRKMAATLWASDDEAVWESHLDAIE